MGKSGLGRWASESQLSTALPTELSALAPSHLAASSVAVTELSNASSFPGVPKEFVLRVRAQDKQIKEGMKDYKRYMCHGDRGSKNFHPLGETDATAYANAFMKATSGVPPHM